MKPQPCRLGHRAPSPPGPSRTRGSSLTGRHPSGLRAQTHEASSARNTLLPLSGPQLPFTFCSVKVAPPPPPGSLPRPFLHSLWVRNAPRTLCAYLHLSTHRPENNCLRESWRRASGAGVAVFEALLRYLQAVTLAKSLDLSKPQPPAR